MAVVRPSAWMFGAGILQSFLVSLMNERERAELP